MHAITLSRVLRVACIGFSLCIFTPSLLGQTPNPKLALMYVPDAVEQRGRADRPMSRIEIEKLRRTEGIKVAASRLRHYQGAASVEKDIIALDLLAVADRSDVIVRGVALSSNSKVTEDGTWIVTDYEIQITEVLDGDVGPGDVVVLRLPGGRVHFEDGSVAEVSVESFRGITSGSDYLLFLARIKNPQVVSRYEFAWGTQGAFEINRRGTVVPLGGRVAPNPKRYADAASKTLLAEARTAVVGKRKLRAPK